MLSAYPVSPDRRSADGRPPVSSGSRAATHLVALCVVPILLDRYRVGLETVIRGYAYTVSQLVAF